MEDKSYQKELFQEFEKPKKSFPKFGNLSIRKDFFLALNLERLIFISIAILMALVVTFALGVEQGKTRGYAKRGVTLQQVKVQVSQDRRVPSAATRSNTASPTPPNPVSAVHVGQSQGIKIEQQVSGKAKPSELNIPLRSGVNPYTIVVAAFSKKEWALVEAEKVKGQGFEAFVTQKNPYFVVCVGAYPDVDSAKRALNKLRRQHKDAYYKLL